MLLYTFPPKFSFFRFCSDVLDGNFMPPLMHLFITSVVSFFAALGFLLYGGRLFLMLRRFPIESKGRRKKLNELYATGCLIIEPLVFFTLVEAKKPVATSHAGCNWHVRPKQGNIPIPAA
eukprot:Gb_41048 [translate_table: standard]